MLLPESQTNDESDEVLATVRTNSQKARHQVVNKYSKTHAIEVFAQGDIVIVKLPRGTRTSTNNKRLFGRVLANPKPHRYQIQTEYNIINRLLPTKELEKVPLSIANSMDIQGPSRQIALSKDALSTKQLVDSWTDQLFDELAK